MVVTVAVAVAILSAMNIVSAAMPDKDPEELGWNVQVAAVLVAVLLVVVGLDTLYLQRSH